VTIFEDEFPGNASVMEKLLATMKDSGVIAFTGAGTSMPALPSWGQLVRALVDEASRDGRLDETTAAALRAEQKDFLYVIDEVYSAVGKSQTKSRVGAIFSSLDQPTECHKIISEIEFRKILTLNYDRGLEIAYAERQSRYVHGITAGQDNEFSDWLQLNSAGAITSILHWHGTAGDANGIVLGGSDYVEFYEQIHRNRENIRRIFSTHHVLMLGFGFADPFIERELNSVMQPISSSDSHFGIIGLASNGKYNLQLERRRYSTKYKLEVIFYPIKEKDGVPDHSDLVKILNELAENCPRSRPIAAVPINSVGNLAKKDTPFSYRSSLFNIGDRQIYCEPNVWEVDGVGNDAVELKTSIEAILSGSFNCNILAPHEYGLTNLGRRLVSESNVAGRQSIYRDANSIPKYRKAIQGDAELQQFGGDTDFTLVIDNFSVLDHRRTLKELLSLFSRMRVIVLQKSSYASAVDEPLTIEGFRTFNLRGLSRSNIRSVVNSIAPSYNSDDTSSIVEKIYSDLIQLCIPLTPSNVIMYSSVLCKDGSFSPVSRLHIVDRFISEALRRASDAYADTFNSINKIDLISGFCSDLFERNLARFSRAEWNSFCNEFKAKNLVEFEPSEILSDLVNGRIISFEDNFYIFRYRMFYSYFVGRHISAHSNLLLDCLARNRHLEIDGLVEVLCGTLPDCSLILDDLTVKLNTSIKTFYELYPIDGFDLHKNKIWEVEAGEGALWDRVAKRLEKGPAGTQELDELKTSIQAERRTDDQKVSIIKFIASE
jgi:hypothetical protein